jgi:hypothetical protein
MANQVIWELPYPSTEIDNDFPEAILRSTILSIRIEYVESKAIDLRFGSVVAMLFTEWTACPEQVLDAYDVILNVRDSDFLRQIEASLHIDRPKSLNHYRLYLDDIGCYEVIAASFELV